MRISDRRDLYPLSRGMGFLELGADAAVQALRHWLHTTARNSGTDNSIANGSEGTSGSGIANATDSGTSSRTGLDLQVEVVHGRLPRALQSLDPVSTWGERILVVPTVGDRWTAWFRNTPEGTDAQTPAGFQAQLLNTRSVVVVDQPGWGVLFATYAAGSGEQQRWVGTAKDSRWVFENNGAPLPWEDTSTFSNRVVRTRFERAQLDTILAGFGLSLEEEFFAPQQRSTLLRRIGYPPNLTQWSLTQIQAMHGWTA